MNGKLKIFCGSSNPNLANSICEHLGVQPGKINIHRFSNDNIKVKIEENVRNDDVFVIQTAAPPVNDHLMELLIIIDALRYASAGRITAVTPYYFYSRSDKKDEPRISITARLVSDLLQTAGANRILAMKLHAPQLMGFPRIPIDQLMANGLLLDYFKECIDLDNTVIVAPDVGSAKGSKCFARALNLPMVIIDKERLGDQEEVSAGAVIGDASGKDVLITDDEILTGKSILQAIRILRKIGTGKIYVSCTHGFFSNNALDKFCEYPIEVLVTTDTLPCVARPQKLPLVVLSVADLFAKAIVAIHEGESVGDLFPADVRI
ncbi:MAG TPA: ribose-phosphate pyrophosphokinase [bacterium]|nr:ribose-phosphate pyrophosphokinase [bacterium]HPG46323.1 ribose-phosphate pyrophosphokinase [bacterium]HPM98483.1 ribose-phosphate pyrophosphokinase [bacterium]